MVKALQSLTILDSGRKSVLRYLRKRWHINVRDVDKIAIDPEMKPGEIPVKEPEKEEEKNSPVILKLNREAGRKIIDGITKARGLKGRSGEAYVIDAKSKFLGLTEYEQSVHESLKTFDDILGRAYNRRTNASSWLLFLILRYYGFSKDDYKPIHEVLTGTSTDKNTKHDPDFIIKYAKYLKLKEDNESKASEFLESTFKGDPKREQKLSLVKLANLSMKTSGKLPDSLIEYFPKIFYFNNLFMPAFAWLLKGTFLEKFCRVMLVANPWVNDFFSEILANFNVEIRKLKEDCDTASDPFKDAVARPDTGKGKEKTKPEINEVELTSLNKEQHGLKRVVHAVSGAFRRLFDRKNNFSSWFLNGLLWFTTGERDYEEFASKSVKNNNFVKNLCDHLKEVRNSVHNNKPTPKLKKDKFPSYQYYIAAIVVGVVSIANALPEKFIKDSSNIVGGIFAVQNLFMPILAEIFTKGWFGTACRIARNFNPLVTDVLDYVSNFRKEILDVKEVNSSIPELLPKLQLSGDKLFGYAINNIKLLGSSIAQFSRKVFGRVAA